MFICPLYIHMPPYICTPQGCTHPHMSPILCALVCVQRLLHVMGVVSGPLTHWTLPLHLPSMGVPPLQFTPHSFVSFSVHWHVSGISVCHMEIFPLCWGFGGVPPYVGGFGGISTWDIHMLILVQFCSLICLIFLLRL